MEASAATPSGGQNANDIAFDNKAYLRSDSEPQVEIGDRSASNETQWNLPGNDLKSGDSLVSSIICNGQTIRPGISSENQYDPKQPGNAQISTSNHQRYKVDATNDKRASKPETIALNNNTMHTTLLVDGEHNSLTAEPNSINGIKPKDNVLRKELEAGIDVSPQRETWSKKLDFLLSVIGFAVDLGNVWRFPYICYKNGGGAFLIPYFIMLLVAGLPLFYMELALGQYQRCGCITVWKRICPMFKGVGYGICVIATFVGMYYNTIIAWSMYYLFASFRLEVPWASCGNAWNTENCTALSDLSGKNKSDFVNQTLSSSEEYYERNVLEMHKSPGLHELGTIKWSLSLCLLATFFIVYFSLWKGIKSSGKAVWITATLPYVVLIILLIRGVLLEGSLQGIIYYLNPRWEELLHASVWIDAAAQVFFSLGPGFGVLLALSSYNKFNNNCYKDALLTASINCLTSFLAGFVVFSVLGYMAFQQGKEVNKVASEGAGLVFVVYPEAIATLTGSTFWAIIFFLMLITLGLDSTFGGLEAVITGICDEYPRAIGRRREMFVAGYIILIFFCALPTCTYGGNYVLTLLDQHGAPISILLIACLEAIAVNWFYGVNRFAGDIKRMTGFTPGIYWKICWAGISPIFLIVLFILSCYFYAPLKIGSYTYPPWAISVGWSVTCASIVPIPIYIIYKFIISKGDIKQRLYQMISPEETPSHVADELQMREVKKAEF
ncbi:unnamed protein product [Owenia fusiformis]|uniref:Transporter n=1 Tax=Owenia fusiformis TaxID=6347 RepID=A0A8J1TKW9_OWEFU|nr:unnamed protein product [Owenia fusiformis]